MADIAASRTHASAQPRRREVGARRDPDPQRSVQPRRGADRRARFLPRRAPPHLRPDGRAQRARRSDRLRHAEGGAVASGRARRGRRAGLHRVARRRRAALGQRRVLRADRQGEVDAPEPDSLGEQDPDRGVRGGAGAGPAARRGRALDLRDRRGSDPRRLRAAARPGAEQLRDDREAAAAQGARHRRADRLPRSRRDDLGAAAVGPGAGRRAARRWGRPASS